MKPTGPKNYGKSMTGGAPGGQMYGEPVRLGPRGPEVPIKDGDDMAAVYARKMARGAKKSAK